VRPLVVLGLLASLATTALANKDAERLFADGKRLLAKKQYDKACAAFAESFAIDPAIGTQLNLGLCYEKWGRWVEAFRAYAEAAKLAREADDDRFSRIRQQLERAGRNVARVVVRVPADADPRLELLLDGKPLGPPNEELAVEPGPHTLVARVPGRANLTEELDLSAGQREVIELDVPRRGAERGTPRPVAKPTTAPRPEAEGDATTPASTRKRGRLIAGIGLTAAGVSSLGVASYVALDARAQYRAAAVDCPGGMCTTQEAADLTNEAHQRARQMTYVFAGGIALTAIGTYLIATSKRAPAERALSGSLVITGREAMVVLGGRL
jgi:tetratricopeptide (TPR) repeat protein